MAILVSSIQINLRNGTMTPLLCATTRPLLLHRGRATFK
jgi:hypothetical protein